MNKWYLTALLALGALPAQAYNIYNETGERLYLVDHMSGGMRKTMEAGGMQSCNPSSTGCSGYRYFVVKPKKNTDDCTPVPCIWNGYIKGKGNYFIIHRTNVAFPQSGSCYIELRNENGETAPAGKCPGRPSGFQPGACGDQSG